MVEGVPSPMCLSWKKILNIVTPERVEKMWLEANITESLGETLERTSEIYRPHDPPTVAPDSQNLNVCPPNPGDPTLSAGDLIRGENATDYLGRVTIPSDVIFNELFYHVTDVTRVDFPEDNVFFTTRRRCAYLGLSFLHGRYQLTGIATEKYFFANLFRTTVSGTYRLTVFFGESDYLPVMRMAISTSDLVVVRNKDFVMGILATYESYSHISRYISLDLVGLFRELTATPISELIRGLQSELVRIEVSGHCGNPQLTDGFYNFFIKVVGAHFLVGQSLRRSEASNAGCLIQLLSEVRYLRLLASTCFSDLYLKGFKSESLTRLAARLAVGLPHGQLKRLSEENRDRALSLIKTGVKYTRAESFLFSELADYTLDIYVGYIRKLNLTRSQRRALRDIYFSLWLRDALTAELDENLLLIYQLATSMCTSLEISRMVATFGNGGNYDVDDTFSPCFMSMRYDFTKEKLSSEAAQSFNLSQYERSLGSAGMFNSILNRQRGMIKRLPLAACVKTVKKILFVVSGENVTFAITTVPVQGVLNYEVSEVFLQNSMYVAEIPNSCAIGGKNGVDLPIPVIETMRRPKTGCPLCRATLLSYDERDGIQSAVYIVNKEVQSKIFNENSPLFIQNSMHIHYLLFLNNGTVVEIGSVYRARAADVLVFVLFFLSFCSGVFVVYKLVSYFC